ncbi:Aste57867_14760 [Aphanomyces stellatus]|uniref:Aste57867_14760 protein n=1 Tax=Aphanomyces stellatus TaxID=120398 RepID=A0A485L2C1_9STRA|nr:hypothetical protein As57867_014705 [Aphanomyces stellatus]VFT91578.1 Aste57867_14760 [Aphanomyces stellatus]
MVSIFQRVQYALSGTTAGRRFQEQMDTATVAMLTHFKALQDAKRVDSTEEKAALFQEAVSHMEEKSFDDHKKLAQEALVDQVQSIFDVLVRGKAVVGQKPNVFSITQENSAPPTAKSAQTIDDYVRQELGYSLSVRDSTIPGAGRGLFLDGHAPAGTAIAFYPGTVYLSEHYRKKYLHVVSNNPFARARFDGAIIDASEAAIPHVNPFALAQMINHPPAETMPNVIPMAFDFPPEEPFTSEPHHSFIPNRFVHPPSMLAMYGKRSLVHSLVLVALNDIQDEEVFLNYRYNPSMEYPDWYTPVNRDEDLKMWS